MNSGELIEHISKKADLPQATVKKALSLFFETVKVQVKSGKKVSIAGFGVFEHMVRRGRTARNPLTGDKVKVPTKKVPKFRPGKNFKELVLKKKSVKSAK